MKTTHHTSAQLAMFKKMTIGDRLRWLLEDREISQTALAEKVGVGQAAISNLVTDSSRKPSAPTLIGIACELECNPNWILTGEGEPYSWAPVTAENQVELLNLFKSMDAAGKQALLGVARNMGSKK